MKFHWPARYLKRGFLARCLRLNPRFLFAAAIGVIVSCDAAIISSRPMAAATLDKYVAAIYRVEGGAKTRWPYGVKSVKVSGIAEAKRVTENSVRNNWTRWHKAGCPGEFTDFMANRWCPITADAVGNARWKKNMRAILKNNL